MQKVGQFHKVSFEEFHSAVEQMGFTEKAIGEMYDALNLPRRATKGSAGYDFFSPFEFTLSPGDSIKIPTGIRVSIEENWMLQIYPRSGLGFKYRAQLDNTVGIVDSDYFYSDNEGHIMIKLTNDTKNGKTLTVAKGASFVQGIFMEYGITLDDDADGIRNGGIGSTTR